METTDGFDHMDSVAQSAEMAARKGEIISQTFFALSDHLLEIDDTAEVERLTTEVTGGDIIDCLHDWQAVYDVLVHFEITFSGLNDHIRAFRDQVNWYQSRQIHIGSSDVTLYRYTATVAEIVAAYHTTGESHVY